MSGHAIGQSRASQSRVSQSRVSQSRASQSRAREPHDHDQKAPSQRLPRADVADPKLAEWYLGKLIGVIHSGVPIGHGACYLAMNLWRHLDRRIEALDGDQRDDFLPRLQPNVTSVRVELERARLVAERLEGALGQLVGVTGVYRVLAARELTRSLEMLREQLRAAHQLELDIVMQAAWDDIGGSG